MRLLDTNIYIYFLENNSEFFKDSERAIKVALQEGPIALSTITVMEVISGTGNQKVLDFFSTKQFRICDFTTSVAILAGKLRYENNDLKAADAIHLATAIENKAKYFVTNDKNLAKLNLEAIEIRSLSAP